jgi:hypothetical protein
MRRACFCGHAFSMISRIQPALPHRLECMGVQESAGEQLQNRDSVRHTKPTEPTADTCGTHPDTLREIICEINGLENRTQFYARSTQTILS